MKVSDRSDASRAGALLLGGTALAAGAARWAYAVPGNDGFAALARALGGAKWLGAASYKPLELLISYLSAVYPPQAEVVWICFGCLHVGLLAALADRLTRALFDDYPAAGLIAAVAICANPYVLEAAFQMNSVLTLAAGVLFLCERLVAASTGTQSKGLFYAVALVALSRVDGLPVAAAGAGVLVYFCAPELRRSMIIRSLAVLAGAGVVWLVAGILVNGSVTGLLENMNSYSRAAAPVRMSVLGFAVWLRGGWCTLASDGLVLMALVVGMIAVWSAVESTRKTAAVAVLLGAHVLVLMVLALGGKPVFYRFVTPHLPVLVALASGGLFWIAVRLVQSSSQRVAAFGLLFLGTFTGYAGNLRELGPIRSANAAVTSDSETVGQCLAPELHGLPVVVVPDRLHGILAYRYRDAPVREITYEREYRTRPAPTLPPVIEVVEPSEQVPDGLVSSAGQPCGKFQIRVYR